MKHLVLLALLEHNLFRRSSIWKRMAGAAGTNWARTTAWKPEVFRGFSRLLRQPCFLCWLNTWRWSNEIGSSENGAPNPTPDHRSWRRTCCGPMTAPCCSKSGTLEVQHLEEAVRPYRNVSVQCGDGYLA